MPLAAMAAGMGGHVRVGLEDSLYVARGQLARSNAEQVEKVVGIVRGAGAVPGHPGSRRARCWG